MIPQRTYLDWNATAPLRPEAREAMLAALDVVGNPSSVHAEGRAARRIVEDARVEVARLAGAQASEVVFTSGASEANTWALGAGWTHVLVAGIEHESVLAPARRSRAHVVTLPVGRDGRLSPAAVQKALAALDPAIRRSTLLSLQLANGETGVLQPVAEIAALAREAGVVMHTDAVQAAGRIDIDLAALGVDLASLSAHKLGGPKGVGALIMRDGFELAPLVLGGGQERRRRAGTENVAAIAGFGAAARAAVADLPHMAEVAALRAMLETLITDNVPGAAIVGASAPRLANTICFTWPGKRAETLVMRFDLGGVAVSAGSACSSGKVAASHVLKAMGLDEEAAQSAIRVSLGTHTDTGEIEAFLAALVAIRGPEIGHLVQLDQIRDTTRRLLEHAVGEHGAVALSATEAPKEHGAVAPWATEAPKEKA